MLDGTIRNLSRMVCRLWEVWRRHDTDLVQECLFRVFIHYVVESWRIKLSELKSKDLSNFSILKYWILKITLAAELLFLL